MEIESRFSPTQRYYNDPNIFVFSYKGVGGSSIAQNGGGG